VLFRVGSGHDQTSMASLQDHEHRSLSFEDQSINAPLFKHPVALSLTLRAIALQTLLEQA